MYKRTLIFLVCSLLLFPSIVWAGEGKSRYATLKYASRELLNDFNDEIRLGRKLSQYMRRKNVITVEDEVLAKIDTIVEKAETILDMFPDNLHITIVLLEDKRAVGRMFQSKYGKRVNHIAYYSLSEDTIYMSVDDARLRVLAHEIGHAIVDHFFKVRPPYNIHELMAQFTEKHITD